MEGEQDSPIYGKIDFTLVSFFLTYSISFSVTYLM